MTSVNNQPYAPRYGYEKPPTPQPVRSGGNTDANANPNTSANSAPPRPPVGPEQRGQFSRHSNIVNQHSQGADSKSEIVELTQKNQKLIAKYSALSEKFSMRINELNTKIDGFIARLSTPGNKTEEAPMAPDAKPQDRRAEGQSVSPPTPPTQGSHTQATQGAQDTPGTEQNQPQGLDKLATELTKIQSAFNQLIEQFNAEMKKLTEKLDKLAQLLGEGTSQHSTPAAQSDTKTASSDRSASETTAPTQSENSPHVNDSTAPAPGSVEYLKHKNHELEAQIEQMEQNFEQTTSKLEQQLDTLTKQARKQKQ